MENPKRKPVRVWCDGCFDLVHYGHANSLRQAKMMGDILVVGVHNDEAITKNKGIPVFTQEQRYKMVRGIKWVDEVVEGSTYFPTAETLRENNCDFATHGDDLSITTDGKDPYQMLKDAGLLKIYKRTEGVSTTDIVNRMLCLTKNHHEIDNSVSDENHTKELVQNAEGKCAETKVSKFLQTSNKIVQFSEGKEPKPGEKIVYVSGDWDLFHPGHLDFLEAARKEGDYLIVGVHSDLIVNKKKCSNYPIMNVNERTLSILACRYVSEVVIGAPYTMTEDMMNQLKIDLVCHGWTKVEPDESTTDPFKVPKSHGKFKIIDTGNRLTTADIVQKFTAIRIEYKMRNLKKETREKEIISTLDNVLSRPNHNFNVKLIA